MERKYKDTIEYKRYYRGSEELDQVTTLRPGLKVVHIGKDVWKVGKCSYIKDPKTGTKSLAHQVIYGPERKEYHVYGEDTKLLISDYDVQNTYKYDKPPIGGSHSNRHGNNTIESSVKIYILTSILDKRENWIFDLKSTPQPGKLKVLYNNGTIKNIDFVDTFEKVIIHNKQFVNIDEPANKSYTLDKTIYPIAYRK